MSNSKRKSNSKKTSRKSAPSKNAEPSSPEEPRPKHFHYFLHRMAETRLANYFVVAADTTSLFKTSSELICDCIGSWKTTPDPDPNDTTMMDDIDLLSLPEADKLSQFGQNIVKVGEILGALQAEDPIAFSSNIQTDAILGCAIPLAKDVVKLKRKLLRISDTVMPDLKELRRLVEIHGLLSNPGETEVDVTEDFGNYDGSVTDSAMEMLQQRPSVEINPKVGCTRWIHILQNMFTNNKGSGGRESDKDKPQSKKSEFSQKSGSKSSKTRHSSNGSQEIEVKPPSIRSSHKYLEKIASALTSPKPLGSAEYILDPIDARVKKETVKVGGHGRGGMGVSAEEEEELWRRLEEARSDATVMEDGPLIQGQPLLYSIQRLDSPMVAEHITDSEVKTLLYIEARKCLPRTEHSSNFQFQPTDQDVTPGSECEGDELNNQAVDGGEGQSVNANSNNSGPISDKLDENLEDCEKTLNAIGIATPSLEASSSLSQFLLHENTHPLLSRNYSKTKQYLSQYRALVEVMHGTVSEALQKIRQVEQSWMNTTTRALGFHNFLKVGDMLDYVNGTILLLSDPQFLGQIYPETRSNILKALDPVYREFHSCFIVLGELAETVTTDAIYLKELLENLPKGDPIVYEFTSNPSLGSFDQIENAADVPTKSITFDVEAIFG